MEEKKQQAEFREWKRQLIATNDKRVTILIGASASGKTTLGRMLEKELGFKEIISTTTRNIREKDNEVDGVNYHFISHEEFDKRVSEGKFVETSVYGGEKYGVEYSALISDDDNPRYVILNADGAHQLITTAQEKDNDMSFLVFWIKMDKYSTMFKRMYKRGDKLKNIIRRIVHAKKNNELKAPWKQIPMMTNTVGVLDSRSSLYQNMSIIYYLLLEHSSADRYQTVSTLNKEYEKLKK